MAMNGWGDAEPAWWLNLEARLDENLDAYAARRSMQTAVMVFEPRPR
jgi:hypothetical protein